MATLAIQAFSMPSRNPIRSCMEVFRRSIGQPLGCDQRTETELRGFCLPVCWQFGLRWLKQIHSHSRYSTNDGHIERVTQVLSRSARLLRRDYNQPSLVHLTPTANISLAQF